MTSNKSIPTEDFAYFRSSNVSIIGDGHNLFCGKVNRTEDIITHAPGKALLFLDASHFVMGCDYLGFIYGKVRRFVKSFSGRMRYNVPAPAAQRKEAVRFPFFQRPQQPADSTVACAGQFNNPGYRDIRCKKYDGDSPFRKNFWYEKQKKINDLLDN